MSDILLDSATHDLEVTAFDLSIVNDIDAIVQDIKVRLWFFRGEWFLDTDAGVPYFADILVKNPNIQNVDAIIKTTIVDTDGVNEITDYESEFDSALRRLTVTFSVNTIAGQATITQEL